MEHFDIWHDDDGIWRQIDGKVYGPFSTEREAEKFKPPNQKKKGKKSSGPDPDKLDALRERVEAIDGIHLLHEDEVERINEIQAWIGQSYEQAHAGALDMLREHYGKSYLLLIYDPEMESDETGEVVGGSHFALGGMGSVQEMAQLLHHMSHRLADLWFGLGGSMYNTMQATIAALLEGREGGEDGTSEEPEPQ